MTSNTFSSNNGIPNEIKSLKRFCLGANGTGGLSMKQPVTFESGMLMSANTNGIWMLKDYHTLVKLVEENNISSIVNAVGFLPPEHIIVIDIDAHNAPLTAEEQSFVDKCAKETYVEKSVSGTGYHILYHTGNPLMMDKLDAVDLGGFTVEIFGGSAPSRYVLLTGDSNGLEIDSVPDELKKCIQNHKKPEISKSSSSFTGDSTNESSVLLAQTKKSPANIYCELFEGKIEEEQHKETRCITDMFDKKFGLDAHHFNVKNNGEWCLYGNNMKGGSLLEAVGVVEGCYDFNTGKLREDSDLSKLIKKAKVVCEIVENPIEITINQPIQTNTPSIYKPYYPKVKNDLPPLMRNFIEAVSLKSDAYPEYSISNMLFIGSLITCGKAKYISPFAFNCTPQPVSFRSFILGQSSISRKTTALKHTRGLFGEIKRKFDEKKPKNYYTSVTFPTDLGNINTEARLCQDFSEHNNQFLLYDEFGSILKTLRKDHNANLRDYLCQICDNSSFSKKLKRDDRRGDNPEYHITNPIFNASVASTPETFSAYASEDDATSGYLYRFLFCCPSYSRKMKSTREIIQNAEEAQKLVNGVSDRLADIMVFFDTAENDMVYTFSDECTDYFDTWVKERYTKLNGEKQFSLQARFETYIRDIAVILHILKEKHFVKIIELDTFKLAGELIDNLFRPSGEFMLDSTMQDDLNKLIGLCKKYSAEMKFIPHTKLLHSSHFDKKKFDLLMGTLEDSARVIKHQVVSKNSRSAYVYQWVESE